MRRTLLLVTALPMILALTGPGVPEPAAWTAGADGTTDGGAQAPTPPAAAPIMSAPPVAEGDTLIGPAGSTPSGSVGEPPVGGGPAPSTADRPSPTEPSTAALTGTPPSTALVVATAIPASGQGPLVRYSLEVDPALGLILDEVAATVSDALLDARSWARTHTIERVDDPARAQIRIVIATPATVDALCATAGLDTAGIFSCWNGRVAALNGWRWEVGARGFDDLRTYRTYLVNHEFGHGLGFGHVGCPAAGVLAPVMMQQSKSVAPCVANGWPFPG
jgi:hypothetical protein